MPKWELLAGLRWTVLQPASYQITLLDFQTGMGLA